MTATADRGISRRRMLTGSAAVGASLWAAPIIDSALARRAAASTPSCLTFNGSWMYVVYSYQGAVFFTGFSKGDTSPACKNASNPHGDFVVTCGGVDYKIHDFSGDPTGHITYGPAGSPDANTATYVGAPNCATYLTISGGKVSPNPATPGVTILASFCFGAGALTGGCAVAGTACAACE
jgi:hypothetical protein